MFEVGVALACRQPSEVLLVRGDHDQFLFDVSAVPHLTLNFDDEPVAVATLRDALAERLAYRNYLNDARTQIAFKSLTDDEARYLRALAAVAGPDI
jgi:hypothetical protein